MEELLTSVLAYLRGMWRYRWWGLAVTWVAGVVLATAVFFIPDQYEARARVYVDTQSVLKPLMQGLAVPTNVEAQVQILSRTLISRPNVEKLIRMADLDLKIKTKEQREQLVDDLIKRLQISSGGRDDLFTLAFKDTNPDQAKRVVQALVSIFVESGLGDKRKDSDDARRFIEEQIKSYEKKLADAENRLKEFKLRNMNLLSDGQGRDAIGQISELNAKLAQSRLELKEIENSRDALRRQLSGEDPVFLPQAGAANQTVSIPEIDSRIDALKKQLDGLLQRYTDQHPDVLGTQRVIEQLEAQKKKEVEARRKAGTSFGPVGENPVYQQLKLSLSEAEANIAQMRTRVAEYEARVAALKSSSRLLPEIEAEHAQLNRDYEVHKRNYEGLVSRREAASMSVEMESSTGVAEFRLIDPPSVPSRPASPNRVLLIPVAGFLSMLLGLALTFVLCQVRPAFYEAKALREVTGLPVLGAVGMLDAPERKGLLRRASFGFFGGVGAYVAVYAVLTGIVLFRTIVS